MIIANDQDMQKFGADFSKNLKGGEIIQLIGDVGAGKTTFTKGLALGLGIKSTINSPTFTISNEYDCDNGLNLVHYDFYRLSEPGIMQEELTDVFDNPKNIVVIEWSDIVEDILPENVIKIKFSYQSEDENIRKVEVIK